LSFPYNGTGGRFVLRQIYIVVELGHRDFYTDLR
jgi:hypothetical protein